MNKEKWIKTALEEGFESFEIYQAVSEEIKVEWYQHEMSSYVTSRVNGTSFRGVIGGKMANMATEDPSDERMEETLRAMKEQAASITSEDAVRIRKPEKTEETASLTVWKKPSADKIKEILKETEEAILAYDPRIVQVTMLEWIGETNRREITNSYGMKVEDTGSFQGMVAGAAAMDGKEVKNGFEITLVHDPETFDKGPFIKKLCDNVLRQFGAAPIPSGTYPVIFEQSVMTDLLNVFTGLFSGDLIGKGISPLKDRLGEKIFAENVTLIDDPRNQDAASLANYDDEGCPTKTKVLVKDGVFKEMLHNTKSAERMHTESTGNGFKRSYASVVGVSPMNLYIVPGEKSLEELCAEMKEGYVITSLQGLHAGIDFVTTNFSLQSSGYWIKDGKFDRSVTLVTVAGNFLDLMKKVCAVGNDLEWSYRSIAAPSIYFGECAVAGE